VNTAREKRADPHGLLNQGTITEPRYNCFCRIEAKILRERYVQVLENSGFSNDLLRRNLVSPPLYFRSIILSSCDDDTLVCGTRSNSL
jgi:hypothetical protein